MSPESRGNAIGGAIGFALAWVVLSFLVSFFVEGMPNLWWLGGVLGAVVVYLLVRRFGGVIRGRP